tara:strand:- start:2585 stop:4090 length:1506 start_codon:yes stop_codon:yes gene_type:complete
MSKIVGIDLGTTFSALSYIDDAGRPVVVYNDDGQNITPSCVHEIEKNTFVVGESARKEWGVSKKAAAARFKRDMGTTKTYKINNHEFSPTDLSTFVLKKLKQDSEKEIGKIAEASVTIPANFGHDAREATLLAAKNAGLNVKYIIDEPTAAALYYAYKEGKSLSGHYVVYDLGGGTFDVSVIKVKNQNIEIVASEGVSKLGGYDFDTELKKLVAKKFKEKTSQVLKDDEYNENDAENDKKSLSKRDKVRVSVGKTNIEITRVEFEESISSLIAQTEMLCETVLDNAKIKVQDIKAVFFAGGSTRIPAIVNSVKKIFKKEPISTVNVDEVVALGASLYAAFKNDGSLLTSTQKESVSKLSVDECTHNYFGTYMQTNDEETGQILLVNDVIIPRGKKIPVSITKDYYTPLNDMESITCRVTESKEEEKDIKFVKLIWEGQLEFNSKRPAGTKISVTFSFTENKTMNCEFLDEETSVKKEIDLSFDSLHEQKNTVEDIDKFLVE